MKNSISTQIAHLFFRAGTLRLCAAMLVLGGANFLGGCASGDPLAGRDPNAPPPPPPELGVARNEPERVQEFGGLPREEERAQAGLDLNF